MTIKVERDQSQPMRHIVHVRNHLISTDAPVADGGADAGPTPHDLYDAALASCKALTMLWYAKRKNIPVEDIRISIERDDSQERAGIYRLTARLHITGELSDAQRKDLLAAAEKCPVQKLMTATKVEVTTTLESA